MGLFSFIKKQFIDVIQWTESEGGVLVYRYPMEGMEIQNGAQLVVRDTQMAMFANEGKVADVFEAGTYTLNTNTLPILTYLQNWDKFFESPFKSDVYFFSMREQIDQKWGTPEPITVRDKEFGVLRIRGNGNYSYRLADLQRFWTNISGTMALYRTADIEGQLRTIVLTSIASFLGQSDVPFIDMAANQSIFSATLKNVVAEEFSKLGLELTSFYVQSLSLPEQLQEHLDRVSSMRMVGDLNKYAQFQTADSIAVAAANTGGVAGAGAGLGAGIAMGQMMMNTMGEHTGNTATHATPAEDPILMLQKLGDLLQKGIVTQAEFDAKKTELLAKIK
jgi:membrane protease subunit (stomatin/prohibitin family)